MKEKYLEITHEVIFAKSKNSPILVEITRGGMIESIHRGTAIICNAKGEIVKSWGDIDRAIYPRSAIKPLQTIPVLESGAADAYKMDGAEIALCCASHSGELIHTERVMAWLKRMELDHNSLECGPQLPVDHATAKTMLQNRIAPNAIHNNCSGKHSGMLATALHEKQQLSGYTSADHPIQIRLMKMIGELGEVDLSRTARGIDGCGIPVFGIPIKAVALAMAKLADSYSLSESRRAAIERIVESCSQNPLMISGTNKINSLIQAEASDKAIVKGGAEGVYTAAVKSLGIGVCIKIDDGAARAASNAMISILESLGVLDASSVQSIKESGFKDVQNWSGNLVGRIQSSSELLF